MRAPRRYSDWRPVAQRRIPARWIGTAVGSLAFVALATWLHHPDQLAYYAAIAAGGFATNRIAARRLKDVRDEGEDRQFAATLRLSRGTSYGHDEGLVAFEDGYLVFMGRRCAFSLGARDVRVTQMSLTEAKFEFRGPHGKHAAHLQWRRNRDLSQAVLGWRAARRRSRESVLPPVLPEPSFPRALIVSMNALPLLALGVAFLALRSAGLTERGIPFIGAAVTLAVAVGLATVQTIELGRLSKGEPRVSLPPLRFRRLRRQRALAPGTHPTPPTVWPIDKAVEAPAEARIDAQGLVKPHLTGSVAAGCTRAGVGEADPQALR